MAAALTPGEATAQLLPTQPSADQQQGASDGEVMQQFIDVLRDDRKRQVLIESLEAATKGEATQETGRSAIEEVPLTFGRKIADYTQKAAETALARAQFFWLHLKTAPAALSALDGDQIGVILDALRDLALVIVTTYAIFIVLRTLAKRIYHSLGRVASASDTLRTLALAAGSTVIDIGVVILAWASGYLITLLFFGEFGSIGIRQTLYLNAFLIVELIKVALRFTLSPTTGDLRLIPFSDAAAKTMTRGFTAIISILGYGQLLVVPIFNQNVSFAAGRAVSVLLALTAIGVAATMTILYRRKVTVWLIEKSENMVRGGFARALARRWHLATLTYLIFLAAIVLAQPGGVLIPVLYASFQVLAGFMAGFAISGWIAGAVSRGIELPDSVNQRLPLLERRLNTFIPQALTVLRFTILIAVTVFALHTVGLVDASGWLQSQIGVRATSALITVAMILIVAFAVWLALSSWVDYRTNPEFGKVPSAREQTLLTLLKNAATIAIIVMTLMFTLSEIGINIAPLIASAGVLGLAIGFGAQKLVQDIITGVFIQLDNAINVGDVITVGGMTGSVEKLSVRAVGLRDVHGSYHIIPFSSVDMVTNFMRDFAYHVCDMGIAYREDHDEARKAMFDAFEILREDQEHSREILGDMEWFGVQALGDSAVVLRSRIKTRPGKQWAIGRAYNGILKKVFDERGIEIPFPHQTIYFGEDKKGNAPPAHIRFSREDTQAKIPEKEDSASRTVDEPRLEDASPMEEKAHQ
ncbi:mechanosensitive ion channel domain-containing protein [Hongsoonwoonella zoysiae]|uniref:mechanosensitive ion channel domain-containing protein n=1 Tax=Hongsoonwoonella zoysiae TaxID=2821844 RepID=UPI001AEE9177|nr:mechanosensitive ion channel domain-containing protein [Hongsoonwoonella zoysiae]